MKVRPSRRNQGTLVPGKSGAGSSRAAARGQARPWGPAAALAPLGLAVLSALACPAAAAARSQPPAHAAASSPETAQDLFAAVLRTYAGYKDFQALFVETPISRGAGEGSPESGTVFFLRPQLWRWEYRAPERKVVVIRGKVASIAVDGEPEVSRYDLGDEDHQAGVALLLSGGEQLGALFSARFEPSTSAKEAVLRLDPLKISDEYDHVLLRVERRERTILEVVVVDPGGNRLRFQFSGMKVGGGLRESLFELESGAEGAAPPKAREQPKAPGPPAGAPGAASLDPSP